MEVSGQLHAPIALLPRDRAPSIHCIGGWVGPKVSLDAKKRNISCPCQELKPGHLFHGLVTIQTELSWHFLGDHYEIIYGMVVYSTSANSEYLHVLT
jgi:hypothetical protein